MSDEGHTERLEGRAPFKSLTRQTAKEVVMWNETAVNQVEAFREEGSGQQLLQMRGVRLACCLAFLVVGCSDDGVQPSSQSCDHSINNPFAGLDFAVCTEKDRYELGESIDITFTVTNIDGQPRTFSFNTSQRYDISVFKATELQWNWANQLFFTPTQGTETLGPGESFQFAQTWDQSTNPPMVPTVVGLGDYKIIGTLTSVPTLQPSPDLVIEIFRR